MPHSSGGGSHSGGSHSSSSSSHSSSSGGGSHSSGVRRSAPVRMESMRGDKRRRGYDRYAYYRSYPGPGGTPYRYIEYYDVKRHPSRSTLIQLIAFFLFMLLFPLLTRVEGFKHPLDTTTYDSAVLIEDDIDVMTPQEEAHLSSTLEAFRDKTGIAIAIITTENDSWEPYYSSLENYAYDLYVNRWYDECHWLFVYSEPVGESSDFVDWHWEGMQGDKTDSLLTTSVTEEFNAQL